MTTRVQEPGLAGRPHQECDDPVILHQWHPIAAVDEIQRSGCLVKDLDMGILDCPALLDGVEVYLCWKLGETKIEWWHSTQEGYSGRRRIIDEFNSGEPNLRPN